MISHYAYGKIYSERVRYVPISQVCVGYDKIMDELKTSEMSQDLT